MFYSLKIVCSSLIIRVGELLAGNNVVGVEGVATVPETHPVPEDEARNFFENEDVQDVSIFILA